MCYKTFDVVSFFAPDKVLFYTTLIDIDGSFIVAFILLLLLSQVFKYGDELQILADKTL